LRTDLENAVGLADLFHEFDGLVDIIRERLFAVDIFARAHGGDGDVGVPVVGSGDDDEVDILTGEDLAEIVIRRAAFVGAAGFRSVGIFDALLGGLASGGIDIAHGEDLDAVAAEAVAQMQLHLLTHADAADGEALARGGLGGPNATRQYQRRGNEEGGGFEEGAAGGARG
jgi:hypothetical protein